MKPVVTTAEIRELDRRTIEELGLPVAVLMENAGRAVAGAAWLHRPQRVVVIAGPGHNGGDGVVAARVLADRGVAVRLLVAAAWHQLADETRRQLEIYQRAGGGAETVLDDVQLDAQRAAIADAEVIVDALLGVGVARPLDGIFAALVAAMNTSKARRIAVDVPSGLDADTGAVHGVVVEADETVTMAAAKVGLVTSPGFTHAGKVTVAEIGIPLAWIAAASRVGLLDKADVQAMAPRPLPLDHKGSRGHVLVIGGGPGKAGAGALSAKASLRSGCGLVTIASTEEIEAVHAAMSERMVGASDVARVVRGKDVVVLGPGLGRTAAARDITAAALALDLPIVVDADALHALAEDPAMGRVSTAPRILTPHPGEAARLLGVPTAEVEADRLGAARQLIARFGGVVVLKGARTIVCDSAAPGRSVLSSRGGPMLATGGSGDVLAGVIASLIAQGLSPIDAAQLGVWTHGAAGERAATLRGTRGVIADDLVDELGRALDDTRGG